MNLCSILPFSLLLQKPSSVYLHHRSGSPLLPIDRTHQYHQSQRAASDQGQQQIEFMNQQGCGELRVGEPQPPMKHSYSVWAVPPEDVRERLKKLMTGLRSEFGGPEFEPHVTVVGAISLTEDDALDKFRAACQGLKVYAATLEKVATGTFFYQCVFLLLHPTPEVMETSSHCTGHFGYKNSTRKSTSAYMPHLSLLYGDLTDEEKKKAQEKANILDESIGSLSFQITRLALYETETEDKTLKSWKMVAECNLDAN